VKKSDQTTAAPVENKQAWMGKGIDGTMFQRDYDAALLDLCREYLAFERGWGSEESFLHAQTLVRSKLANWDPAVDTIGPIPSIQEESHGKRKLEANDSASSHPENGSSTITENDDKNDDEGYDKGSKRSKVKTNLKQPKKTDGVHRVHIGKLDYPAHPYTIHVSNLSKDTQDMDLVDAFLHDFGAVVHARILRDKLTGKGGHHFKGESKCVGLIQFEERSSVENALRRDGKFEVQGRPVKIQRSHMPAVGVVPAGMHRVNPKGEGKVSKQNTLKKSNVDGIEFVVEGKGDEGQTTADSDQRKEKHKVASASSPSSLSLGVLSLKPRGVRQKLKISFDSSNKK
jgi:RNA recognition motif-containing protein